jgi:glyoxylase-like metal-dependent hydrolase (beta-lactamase superfamily II)
MLRDTKLYYCPAAGHLWYYDEDGEVLFYGDVLYATDEELEDVEEKYCGCND